MYWWHIFLLQCILIPLSSWLHKRFQSCIQLGRAERSSVSSRTAKHWPCSAKRERRLPGSESSSWPAARIQTKCSRKRTGHSCEHRIFHVTKLRALQKSPGHRGSSGVKGDHFDPALHCVMSWPSSQICPHQGKHAPSKTGSKFMVLREGESSSSAEERGEECSLGQCLTFPARSEGERSGITARGGRSLIWMNQSSCVETCL